MSEKEACPGQQHVQIGVRGPAWVPLLLKTIPLTQEEDRVTGGVGDQDRVGTPRGRLEFLQAAEGHKTALLASFSTHGHSPFPD